MSIRIGYGFDVHQLAEGYDFWLGGIKLEHITGSVGHSDADVLLHAICDALLGALALKDIGYHFPDTDPKFKGIDSKILLKHTYDLILKEGYELGNLDSTICLQEPKIKPHIDTMRNCIADVMQVSVSQVSVKATTTEKMGFEGRGEGVSAHATVLLLKQTK
tara:strand:- start:157501 stop:157986 length:486 start_codon:yes stop_codon:yes gene_type:complete